MPLDALEAAKKVCRRSGWRLSNLELNKVLYLAQVRYKRAHPGRRLINTTFEAWDYGPVSPPVYHRSKAFGSDKIGNVFHAVATPVSPLDADLYASVDKLVGMSPAQLVAVSHRDKGAWATYYQPGVLGIKIPDAAIDREAAKFSSP